jgi:glucose-6-phosphate 1-epimerase
MILPFQPTALYVLQVYTVTLHGEQLKTDFRVINTGDKPFEFTTALHTYIEVLDVNKAKVRSRGGSILSDCDSTFLWFG